MSDHIGDANKMVEDYRQKAIEDGERIYTLGIRSDRYRAALLKARERIKKLEAKADELNDLKKWLEGR